MRNYKVQYKNSYQYQVKQRHRKKVSSSASIMFSSYDPMGPVSYCHHLASVVCQPLLTFQMLIISCETAGTIRTKHAWMMFVRFFTKFYLDLAKTWPLWTVLVADWLNVEISCPLKLLGQLKLNFAIMVFVRSKVWIPSFVLIREKTLAQWVILDSDWLNLLKIICLLYPFSFSFFFDDTLIFSNIPFMVMSGFIFSTDQSAMSLLNI